MEFNTMVVHRAQNARDDRSGGQVEQFDPVLDIETRKDDAAAEMPHRVLGQAKALQIISSDLRYHPWLVFPFE